MQWSTFQTALIIAFGLILFIAVLIFAGILPGRNQTIGNGGTVVLWGTLPETAANAALEPFKRAYQKSFNLTYVAHNPDTIEGELVEALAEGRGPDLVMLPHEAVWLERNKLVPFSFDLVSERDFLDTYVGGAELYLAKTGSWALPLAVDPLVLFYNPDLLAAGKFATPPQTWVELQTMAKTLSSSDSRGNLSRSAIPLGEFGNILHAKDILSLLMLQTGNPIAELNRLNGALSFTVGTPLAGQEAPATAEAVSFFTRFSDPSNTAYSWNAAQPEARAAFTRGQAVFYLGYASEYEALRRQNPQLALDVARVPQLANNSSALTFGRLVGFSLPRGAKNPVTAAEVARLLTMTPELSAALAGALGAAPASAKALAAPPSDPAAAIAYQSALIARAWLDPDPETTKGIFDNLFRAVKTGRLTPVAAVQSAQQQLAGIRN